MTAPSRDPIRVLHVDDDPDFADLAAEFLERENDRFVVETATNTTDSLARLADAEFDCIVSDYDMPGTNGIEFLVTVREDHPDLPFILFTGKGSEEVASEAISAGVTDYLQKRGGNEQYTVLANRIENAVERTRAELARRRHLDAIETAQEGISILDADGRFVYVNEAYAALYGYDPEELLGEHWELLYPDDEVPHIREEVLPTVERTGRWHGTTTGKRADGSTFREDHVLTTTADGELVCTVQDVTDREERERELERIRARFHALTENTNLCVLTIDADSTVLYANDAVADVFGYAPDELVGESLQSIMPQRFHDAHREGLTRYLKDGTRQLDWEWIELPGRHRDGYEVPLGISFGETTIEGERRFTAIVRDITAYKKRERDLERYRMLVDTMHDPACIIDESGRFEIVNDALADLYGTSPGDLRGRESPLVEHVRSKSDPDPFRELLEGLRDELQGVYTTDGADGASRSFEYRLSRPPGDEEFDGVVAVSREVTDRKRREESLSALHERTGTFMQAPDRETVAEHAVETARDVLEQPINTIWLYDEAADALRPEAWTDEAIDLLGDLPTYTGGDSLSWQAFQEGEVAVYDGLEDVPNRYNPDTPIESEVILPLGEVGVLVIGSTDAGAFDDIDVSLARILADVVEAALDRADREQTLRSQRRELERQNDRLEEFASVVSHDLRNPLNVAEGKLELAREERDSERLESVARAHDRMEELIEDILTLARKGDRVSDLETVALADLCRSCWRSVETGRATLNVETDLTIRADRSRLRQLLENLFRNAVEHGGPGVTVTVGALPDGFSVEDDGPGIPEHERERIFESGYTTSADGTGFGLAIANEIAQAHGWTIDVAEGDDGGARFEITGVDVGSSDVDEF